MSIYIYIYVYKKLVSFSLYVYIYMYIHAHMYICIYHRATLRQPTTLLLVLLFSLSICLVS